MLGAIASLRIAPLLSNTFSVPGTDSERARTVLEQHFGERPDGAFQLVFRVDRVTPAARARAQPAACDSAAALFRGGAR